MVWQWTPYIIPLLVAAAALIGSACYVFWRRRHAAASRTGVLLLLASAQWMLGYVLELASADFPAQVFWDKVQFVGTCILPTGWLVYVIQYTGRQNWLTRRRLALLSIVPLVTLLLVFTNEAHGLIWSSQWLEMDGLLVIKRSSWGMWLWAYAAYSHVLVIAGIILLFQALIRSGHLYRWQAAALLVTVLASWLANAAEVLFHWNPILPLEMTPLALCVTLPAVAWSSYRLELRRIVPVARASVIESMEDGVLVLDAQDRIVDLNPAAQGVIGADMSEAIGRATEEVWPRWRDGVAALSDGPGRGKEIALGQGDERRVYDVRASSLTGWRRHLVGRVVVLRDITERKRYAAHLERKTRDLELVHQVSQVIGSSLDLNRILQMTVEQMATLFGVDHSGVLLFDEAHTYGQVVAEYPSSGATEERFPVRGYLAAERIIAEQKPLVIENVWDDPLMSAVGEAMHRLDIQSMLIVPVIVKGCVIGSIGLDSVGRRRRYSTEEVALAQTIASQVAIAIENARLFKRAQQELAERERAEEQLRASLGEKEVLLQEIHHRVKNNLQVIASLLNLQADCVQDGRVSEVFRESQNRIHSMALIHEQLYRSQDLARIDFAGYLENLARYLIRVYGSAPGPIDLKVDADDIPLPIDVAIPCGLIVGELVSNSLKHAFPSGEGGAVRVGFQAGGEKQLQLLVGDNGVGLPSDISFEDTETLGLHLVHTLVQQLGGRIELDRGQGTVVKTVLNVPEPRGVQV